MASPKRATTSKPTRIAYGRDNISEYSGVFVVAVNVSLIRSSRRESW